MLLTLQLAVMAFGLLDCWKAKPLLTGKEVDLPCMPWGLCDNSQGSQIVHVTCDTASCCAIVLQDLLGTCLT